MMILGKSQTVWSIARAVGFLFLVSTSSQVIAQASPSVRYPPSLHAYATMTTGTSDLGIDNSIGFSLGGYAQTRHRWGLEARGDYLHWGYNETRYDAVVGPRVAIHHGRFSPYGGVLVGLEHEVIRYKQPPRVQHSGTGEEFKVLAGVDYYAGHHFSLRLGEISFSQPISIKQGSSAVDFSAGFVYRIHFERGD